jgi:tetratricopeptide (TPR) repeat protein
VELKKGIWSWYYCLLVPIFLATVTAIVYYPSLKYEFQFDDIANITKHFNIRHYSFKRLFFSGPRWISYWINSLIYKLEKFEPFFYRLFNISLHIVNGLLIFFIFLYALSRLKKSNFFKTHAFGISTVTALLFLLHPVQTQTVSYVIQGQLEGLCCMAINCMVLFFLLRGNSKQWLLKLLYSCLLFICAFLACGTKEIAIIAPLIVILCDWFFIAQGEWKLFKQRIWIHALLCLVVFGVYCYLLKPSFFTEIVQLKRTATNNIGNIITSSPKQIITPWIFFISQFNVILHYLWIFIWPFSISVEYDWKLSTHFFAPEVLIPFLILCSILWIIVTLLRAQATHLIAFGLIWFLIAIAPRSSIIPSPELLVDYKTYTASIGWLFVLACASVYIFSLAHQRYRNRFFLIGHRQFAPIATVLLASMLFGIVTARRNHVWRSGLEFWGNIIKNAPQKARAYNNYGVELSQKLHKFAESIPYFKKAISMDAHYPDPCNNLAVAYSQTGKIDQAIQALKEGIRINPYYPEGYNNLASFYVQQKKFDDAEKILKTALRLRPHYGKAYFNLGRVYLEKNDTEKAWECFKACCMNADLDNEFGFTMYAKSSMVLKKYADALVAFTRLLEYKPNDYEVQLNLANVYCLNKLPEKALPIYKKLNKCKPDDLRVLYNMAEAHVSLNNIDDALALFSQLKKYEHQFPHINIRMAACYEKIGHIHLAKQLLAQLAQSSTNESLQKNASVLLAELNKKYAA